jgi:hypothetical protein
MDNALLEPVLTLDNASKTAPLCSLYAQVTPLTYNPHKVRELCKENVVDWLYDNGYGKLSNRISSCGLSFMHLSDSKNHEKYARLRCKNEFCPSCGAQNSALHKKRVRRASLRLLWNGLLGYFVFTIPKEISESRPSKEVIENLTKEAWDIVKKNFDTPGGLSRIHLMGDEPGKLHVHINFLYPLLNEDKKGMISKDKIALVRNEWKKVLNKLFNLELTDANFYYSFADKLGKKIHKIKYVLRPVVTSSKFLTLSDEDRKYVLSFSGCQSRSCYDKATCKDNPCYEKRFHGTRWHGDLSNSKYKNYLKERDIDVDKIEAEIEGLLSPVTGEKYHIVKLDNGRPDIVRQEDLPLHELRWLDNDTLVDQATFAYISAHSPGG